MKTIIKIFAAVLTAVPVLASCYSEPLPEIIPEVIPEDEGNGSEQDTTVRVITVSFDTKATRTELSGDYFSQPVFVGGEVIMVAQEDGGKSAQRCTVNVVNGVASFETTLQDDLVAVYPADCAIFGEPNEDWESWIRGGDEVITGVMAPNKQDGTFANANICKAEIAQGQTDAVFINQTAVFVVDVPEGTTMLIVTSLEPIDSETGQRGSDDDFATISMEWDDKDEWYYSINTITIGDGKAPIPEHCFVSIMAEGDDAVLLRDLNFNVCLANGQGFMGGFSPKFLTSINKDPKTARVQAGAIYTGVEDHLHEYISNPHSFNEGYYTFIWAKKDLNTSGGNTTDFFMWGELSGHSYKSGSWTNFTDNNIGFASGNSPNYSTSFSISSYNSGDILRLEDDAAYYNWGGAWRMPKFEEMETWSGGASTNAFPMTLSKYGFVQGNGEPTQGAKYYYWTSEKGKAFYYNYNAANFVTVPDNPEDQSCFYGMLIRPMSGIIEEIIEEYESD